MAHTARNRKLAQAANPKDRLLASLNWRIGLSGEADPDYQASPSYYDAAWEWYRSLSLSQKDMVSAIVAAWSTPDRLKAAERLAAALPASPRCPL
jgi:hypothetical protein